MIFEVIFCNAAPTEKLGITKIDLFSKLLRLATSFSSIPDEPIIKVEFVLSSFSKLSFITEAGENSITISESTFSKLLTFEYSPSV